MAVLKRKILKIMQKLRNKKLRVLGDCFEGNQMTGMLAIQDQKVGDSF